jgi:hypothetical protein
MSPPPGGQRNPYRGVHPRAWVFVSLIAPDGTREKLDLVADTGGPFHVVIDSATLLRLQERPGPPQVSTYGTHKAGWVRVVIPEVALDQKVLACESDVVVSIVQDDDPDFSGILGLPLLRLMEYGGDATDFWIRPAGTTP